MAEPLVAILAVFYLTQVITQEKGPLHVFYWLRRMPLTVGEMAQCPICAAFWAALAVMVLQQVIPVLVMVLAYAGLYVSGLLLWKNVVRIGLTRMRLANAGRLQAVLLPSMDDHLDYLKQDGDLYPVLKYLD